MALDLILYYLISENIGKKCYCIPKSEQLLAIVLSKIDENRCKQIVASLPDFGRAGSLSLQLY